MARVPCNNDTGTSRAKGAIRGPGPRSKDFLADRREIENIKKFDSLDFSL